jgi:hypothetical protein
MARDWVVTLDRSHNAQLRRGVGLPVEKTVPFKMFDFLPTNSRDGTIVAGLANGTIFVAVPK